MRRQRWFLSLVASLAMIIALGAIYTDSASAATGPWQISTTNVSLQGRIRTPTSADGDLLALVGTNSTDSRAYLYNIRTYHTFEFSAPLPGSYYNPCINSGWVTFQGAQVGGFDDIYLYNVGTSTLSQLTHNSSSGDSNDWNPRIHNKRVVWEKDMVGPSANPGIYLYDIDAGTTSLIIAGDEYRDPDIYGDYVVCVKNLTSGGVFSSQIAVYNLVTETLTLVGDGSKRNEDPRIDNGRVVWSAGDTWSQSAPSPWLTYQIMMYDIGTTATTALTNNAAGNFTPSIGGDLVSWVTKTPWTIQVKNLSTGQVVRVYGSSIAWIDDYGLHTMR